jgi:aspartate racemase
MINGKLRKLCNCVEEDFNMKTIGLIGGMRWESTLEYYRIIDDGGVGEKLGKLHSAKIFIYSFNFEEIEKLQRRGKWKEAAKLIVKAAKKVENAGADFILICTNTMHKVANEV